MTTTDPITATDRTALRASALAGVRALLLLAGEDPDHPGLIDTPRRMVDAFLEMTARPGNPSELLARTFGDIGPVGEMVTVGPVTFTSLCEHHLLPFTGRAWVAYRPRHVVVGLSKIPRLVEHYARRPQIQERLTNQIADAMHQHLAPHGVGVRIKAEHCCMTLRGVRIPGTAMATVALRGDMTEGRHRDEFQAAAQ